MDKYRTALSMGILSSMEYRFDFFIGFIGMIFPIVIQVFLWLAVYGGPAMKRCMATIFRK